MLGPVMHLELLLGSRRGRFDVLRRLYAGWLILQFTYFFCVYLHDIWRSMLDPPFGLGRIDPDANGRFVESYLNAYVAQQFLLLFLLTPAFVAGAITDEKSRGTLQYLLTTGLTTWEIVIGKLLGRLTHLATLALAGLPLVCLMAPFDGFDLLTVFALAAATLLPLFTVGAVAMLASVWARQTRDAVLGVYAVAGIGALLLWSLDELAALCWPELAAILERCLLHANPLYLVEPVWGSRGDVAALIARLAAALLLWGGVGGLCLAVAVWRLRPAYMRQLADAGREKKPLFQRRARVADGDEPIRWREQQVDGIAPLPVFRLVPRWLGVSVVAVTTLFVSLAPLIYAVGMVRFQDLLLTLDLVTLRAAVRTSPFAPAMYAWLGPQNFLVAVLFAAVVGVRCSGAVSGERERQTWEALLLTPLPVRELIRNKLRGIMAAARPYLIAYGAPALAVAALLGLEQFFWVALGLLATWPAMYFVGAAGLYYSVRSATSWKSLLGTLGIGFLGALMIATMTAPLVALLSGVLFAIVSTGTAFASGGVVWFTYFLMPSLVLAWSYLFWRFAERFLVDAQKRVVGNERTPYWRMGVNCGVMTEFYMNQFENRHA